MRDNLYNTDDPALITKKFWSHHKFTTKSHRLPECMHYKKFIRNKPHDKSVIGTQHYIFNIYLSINLLVDYSVLN